jgi:uncharacterized protein (TIGR03118 family)
MINIGVRTFTTGLCVLAIGLSSTSTSLKAQQHYKQTNLVSDLSGMGAMDAHLVNPWGISRSSTSPWWVSDNGTGVTTLYMGTGSAVPLVVTIPPSSANKGQTGTPTGQIFNGTQNFWLAPGMTAVFIFATEDGTISGWNPKVKPTDAVIKVDTKNASVFKGLAVATLNDPIVGPTYFLYAADFRKGQVAVYDTNFNKVSLPVWAFKDSKVPFGFAPFNIQNIGGNLYVAWAKPDSAKHDEVDGAGLGFVDVFTPTGQLIRRMDWGSWFNAPWGMALAPTDFGAYSHDLLVGEFGSGQILVFDPNTGHFLGRLRDAMNAPIAISGLWGINFGSDATAGPATTLFFAAGLDGESHGLFGTITPIENVLGGDH